MIDARSAGRGGSMASGPSKPGLRVEVTDIGVAVAGQPLGRLPEGATLTAQHGGPANFVESSPEEVTALLQRVASAVNEGLRQVRPDDWSVEFGLSFKGNAGIPVIAAGEATTNLKVTMTWRKTATR
jgi:hypothetical protein